MSRCKRITKPSRRVCIGDLRDQIVFCSRTLDAPDFVSSDFDETFATTATVMASIRTLKAGTTIFDGVNQDKIATHEIVARFRTGITAEDWIESVESTKRFDILTVDDLEERHLWLSMMCAVRGVNTIEATKA